MSLARIQSGEMANAVMWLMQGSSSSCNTVVWASVHKLENNHCQKSQVMMISIMFQQKKIRTNWNLGFTLSLDFTQFIHDPLLTCKSQFALLPVSVWYLGWHRQWKRCSRFVCTFPAYMQLNEPNAHLLFLFPFWLFILTNGNGVEDGFGGFSSA